MIDRGKERNMEGNINGERERGRQTDKYRKGERENKNQIGEKEKID